MRRNFVLLLLTVIVSVPAIATAQDAQSIMETAREKQVERWEGVDLYVVDQSVMGNSTQTYFQRTRVEDDAGNSIVMFLPARNGGSQCPEPRTMTPEELELFADAAEMTGDASASEIENGLEDAGLPRGLLAASGSDPTATFDPRVMMGANAEFLRGAAEAKRQQDAEDPGADGANMANQMAQFVEEARLVGTESIDGRSAFHLQASDIGQVQEMNGGEYRMETMSMWIDTEEYVPLRMKMDGTLTADGETKPMSIENTQTDYRRVPGSNMYESYKQVMNMSGMLDPEQEAQMQEAAEQMAELEKQMASMPASQRDMMEKMMGPQLEMIRNMSAGGGFQVEVITSSIMVNPPIAGVNGEPCPTSSSISAASAEPKADASSTDETLGLAVLTTDYLEGHWCTEVTQERSLYSFAADGTYRLGVVGITITQMDGINYFPDTYGRREFLDQFDSVSHKDADRFTVRKEGGSELTLTRGNCFE